MAAAKASTGAKVKKRAATRPATKKAPRQARAAAARKAASDATAAARAKGATGRGDRLRGAQLRIRDSAVMACLHAGEGPTEVARTFGISRQAVYGIRKRIDEAKSPLDERPMQILEELARNYRRSAGDLLTLAHENLERAPHVSLGAIKAAADAWRDYERLMSDVGKLPENLELFRAESVLRRIGAEMVDVVTRVSNEELAAADALGVLEDLMARLGQPEALELAAGAVTEEAT